MHTNFATRESKLKSQESPFRDKSRNMKFHTEYITLHTKTKRAYVHITPQAESALKKSGIKDGMILVSAMHITAGVYVNDNESGLIQDIDQWLEDPGSVQSELQAPPDGRR